MHDRLMPRVGKLLAIVLLLIAVQAVTADPANCQERDTDTATAQKEKAARRARSTNFRTKARKVKEGEAIADQATFETAYLAAVEAFESMRSTAVGLKIAEENGDQEARDELAPA